MPTAEEYRGLPIETRCRHLEESPDELARAVGAYSDAQLSLRPDAHNWSAKEIICHLRDVEELFQIRFHTMLALDGPPLLVLGATPSDLARWRIGGAIGHPLDPERWAEDRQYRRQDAHEALTAWRRRRSEVLILLRSLSTDEWQRGGVHLSHGRLSLADWVASLAAHDDNHLAQFGRALEGRS